MGMHGKMVRVVSGKKAPLGFEGYCFWEKAYYAFRNARYPQYVRIGIKNEAGEVAWTYDRNVTEITSAADLAAAAAEAKAMEDKAAAKEAFLAKFDWASVLHGKEIMESYGGHSECSMIVANDLSDEEVIKAIRMKYPAESSWGALRWSRGASSVRVEHDAGLRVAKWNDGYGMCD